MSISTSVSGVKNGYLTKESYYLKQQRKRWIVLNRNYLYSYRNVDCARLTEKIDLSKFDSVEQTKENSVKFELVSNNNNKTYTRKFFAPTNDICNEWVEVIRNTIQTSKHKNSNSKDIKIAFNYNTDQKEKESIKKPHNVIQPIGSAIPHNLSDIMNKYHSKINAWDFDIFEFMDDPFVNGKGLMYLSFYIFKRCHLLSITKINEHKLYNFLCSVSDGYLCNPYHNQYHSIDVFMAVHYMFNSLFFRKHMTVYDRFACYISALCHDLGHMGLNNNWYINTGNNLALLYNDISVLENYHITNTFQILNINKNNWMQSFPLSIKRYLTNVIKKTILSTDNGKHNKKIKQFENMVHVYKKAVNINTNEMDMNKQRQLLTYIKLERCESIASYANLQNIIFDGYKLFASENNSVHDVIIKDKVDVNVNDDEKNNDGSIVREARIVGINDERIFLLEITLHLCDISNPCKPLFLAKQWANRYLEEAFAQGDKEKNIGIPISMGMDRDTVTLPKSQIGFIDYVVKKAYLLYRELFETADEACKVLEENKKYWVQQNKKQPLAPLTQ